MCYKFAKSSDVGRVRVHFVLNLHDCIWSTYAQVKLSADSAQLKYSVHLLIYSLPQTSLIFIFLSIKFQSCNAHPRFLVVRHFPVLQIPVTHDFLWFINILTYLLIYIMRILVVQPLQQVHN